MTDVDERLDAPNQDEPVRSGSFAAPDAASIRASASGLPWWRRPRELRRQLAGTLVATVLASVLFVGGLNYYAASDLLDEGTQDQLIGIGEARARTIENGVDSLIGQISALSGDLGIVAALEEFGNDFDDLDSTALTSDQTATLEAHYEERVVDGYDAIGLGPVTVDEFLPADPAARYLQYHYTVAPIRAGTTPDSVVDAGDGSGYSTSHATHHDALKAMLSETAFGGDAMLVTLAGDVVYSVNKRLDLGTNLFSGPYRNSNLAGVLRDRLPRVPSGDAVIADAELYLPAQGRPVIFAAAAVKNDTATIGVLVVEVPIDAISSVTTSNQQWERFGLQTGESYVVGADLRLRSESRQWIEDPDGYLAEVDDDDLELLMSGLGSPIGLQVVDTEPARAAFDGDEYSGTSANYFGTKTFSYAAPMDVDGVDWIVIVDIPLSDARSPLFDYARRLGLVLLVILPVAAIAGLWLARRLTRPIGPVLESATAIVRGERNLDIPDYGNDEFGDLARRLRNMAEDLGEREAALQAEFEDRRALLLSVLPPRLVDDSGGIAADDRIADVATVIAVSVDASADELIDDDDRVTDLLDQVAVMQLEAIEGRNVERIRGAADSYLYVVGAGTPADGSVEALDVVTDLLQRFGELRDREDVAAHLRIGVATGPVATALLDGGSLTFGAWGLPVRQALALCAMSRSDQVLIDTSTATASGSSELIPADDVVALDSASMELFSLAPTLSA